MQTLKFSVLLLAGAVLVAACGGCAPVPYYYDEVVIYAPGPGDCPRPPRPPRGQPSATGTAQPTPRDTPLEQGRIVADTATRTRDLRPDVRVRVPRAEAERTAVRAGPVGDARSR